MIQNAINFPKKYTPGFTDNFASNELIVENLDFDKVVYFLSDTSTWENYYKNSSDINLKNQNSSILNKDTRFSFKTFGFAIEAQIEEFLIDDTTARIAWHGWNETSEEKEKLDVYHAWLIEKLDQNRVRILTQESQIGQPAKEMAEDPTHPMINGHQEWIKGLIKAAQE